jgi:hypothetical protein
MRTSLLAACLVLACAVPAFAQSAEHPLRIPTLVFVSSAAADWATTYTALSRGGYQERNPLWAAGGNRPGPTVAMGAAFDVIGVVAWNRLVGRRHPRWAAVGLYSAATFRLWCVGHNLKTLNR